MRCYHNVWKEISGGTIEEGDYIYAFNNDTIWTSYDILNTDGSVYLAASDPVPVYE